MKIIKYFLKIVAWSVGISVGIRIVFGLYSVFGPPILLISLGLAIAASLSLSASSNAGFMTVSLLHMIMTTTSYIFFDYSGLFLTLASDTARFFSKFTADDSVKVNLLWCIMFVMPVYFFCFIVSSGVISSLKSRKLRIENENEEYYDVEDDVIPNRK